MDFSLLLNSDDGDHASKMRMIIDMATDDDEPYVSRQVAHTIVKELERDHPEFLREWLSMQAEVLVWQMINTRDRSQRATVRASRSVFRQSAEEAEQGNPTKLRGYLELPFVVEDGTRKSLSTLDHNDLRYVAKGYHARMASARFEEAFFLALARRVTSGVVSDHFTEEQIHRLRGTISWDMDK